MKEVKDREEKQIKIEVLGGCGEYGRNCFYIENEQQAILLDCGILNDGSNKMPRLEKKHIEKLQGVFLSHLHLDHIGALSLLDKFGYQGPVVLSKITKDWVDSELHLQWQPFEKKEKGKWQQLTDTIQFLWGNSGHVIGSVWYCFKFNDKTIFYSGDVSLSSTLYPVDFPPLLNFDVALIDSGNVGETIDNLNSKEKMYRLLETQNHLSFEITSKFTAKCLELLLYFYERTKRTLVIDAGVSNWLNYHERFQEELLPKARVQLNELLHSRRLKKNETVNRAIYFSMEQHHNSALKLASDLNQFPFKSHLDTSDIYYLDHYIGANRTIYFHNKQVTATTTLEEIMTMTNADIIS